MGLTSTTGTMNDSTDTTCKSPRRRVLFNLVLAVGATIVALCFAELVVRLLALARPPVVISQESRDLFIRSPIAGLHYELRPGFTGRAYGCEIKVNSHGMRSPERPVAKPANVRRVLILGDSVVFGHGVGQSLIFPAVLEKSLNDPTTAAARVEVINTGVPGYNSEQERICLREKGMAWQPDVVVVVAVANDAEPPYDLQDNGSLWWTDPPAIYREVVQRYIAGSGPRWFLRRHLRVFDLLDRALSRPYFLTRRYLDYLDGLYAPDSPGWRSAQAALTGMRDLCRARGIAFLMVHCPIPERPEPEILRRLRERFADFAHREGITYLDVCDAEASYPVKAIILSPLDRHPTPLGHRLIADAMAPLIERELARRQPVSP